MGVDSGDKCGHLDRPKVPAVTAESRERERAHSRRPIAPDEVPYLEAMGAEVRRLRLAGIFTQAEIAEGAEVACFTLRTIERGTRRTRRSTLARIARELQAGLVLAVLPPGEEADPDPEAFDTQVDELVERLVALAGPALAPESPYADRSVRRRERRSRKKARREQRDQIDALRLALPMAKRMLEDRRRTGEWPASDDRP